MDGMCRTRFRLCALAVGLVVLALPARSRTAFAWAAGDGYYSLINRHSGSALDVIGASTESGAAVIQYLGHLNANQQWLLREVVATPQVTTADAIRFLEQSTWGPTPELVAHVQSVGFEQFLERAVRGCRHRAIRRCRSIRRRGIPWRARADRRVSATTTRSIRCRTGSSSTRSTAPISCASASPSRSTRSSSSPDVDITQPSWMTPYLQMLDRNALGNYRQLLYDISLNPAMGNYLDIAGNTKAVPNENYAREILQLFSIGTVRLNPDGTQQLDGDRPADPGLHPGRRSTTSRACSPAGSGPPRRRRACRTTSIRWSRTSRSTTSAPRRC